MASFVSGLISKQLNNLPFIGNQQQEPRLNLSANDLSDLNRLATSLNDRTQTDFTTPSAYTQFVDKLLLNTTINNNNSNQQVNRQSIMQGIKLVGIAVDEFDSGNEDIALNVYLSGLDKIIMSLPNLKGDKTKSALKDKLTSLEDRVGVTTGKPQQQLNSINDNNNSLQVSKGNKDASNNINISQENLVTKLSILSSLFAPSWLVAAINTKEDQEEYTTHTNNETHHEQEEDDESLLKFKQINKIITDIVIQCVIAFKKSPLPGLLWLSFSCLLQFITVLNQRFKFIEKAQQMTIVFIKKFLDADEKYHLHEFASETLYTFISAALKALVAYKETPGYMEQKTIHQDQQQVAATKPSWIWSRSAVAM